MAMEMSTLRSRLFAFTHRLKLPRVPLHERLPVISLALDVQVSLGTCFASAPRRQSLRDSKELLLDRVEVLASTGTLSRVEVLASTGTLSRGEPRGVPVGPLQTGPAIVDRCSSRGVFYGGVDEKSLDMRRREVPETAADDASAYLDTFRGDTLPSRATTSGSRSIRTSPADRACTRPDGIRLRNLGRSRAACERLTAGARVRKEKVCVVVRGGLWGTKTIASQKRRRRTGQAKVGTLPFS